MHGYEITYLTKDPETGLIDTFTVRATDYNRAVCKFNAIGLHLDPETDDLLLSEFDGEDSRCVSVKHSRDYPDRKLPCVIYDSEEVA